jgi:GNAT superfamily N-acetyltransferase
MNIGKSLNKAEKIIKSSLIGIAIVIIFIPVTFLNLNKEENLIWLLFEPDNIALMCIAYAYLVVMIPVFIFTFKPFKGSEVVSLILLTCGLILKTYIGFIILLLGSLHSLIIEFIIIFILIALIIFEICMISKYSLKIKEYFGYKNKDMILNQISFCEWDAGKFLYQLLVENKLKELCGSSTKLYVLMHDKKIVSFATYAEKDDIDTDLYSPWIGFVYTYPEFRGNRAFGKLLKRIISVAKKENKTSLYVSTNETGLYEKYGFTYFKEMNDINNCPSKVYKFDIKK